MRGLAEALARELHPQNIYIEHFVIDGGIRAYHCAERQDDSHDNMLDLDAIAESYLQFHRQNRSAWAWKIELRPLMERFKPSSSRHPDPFAISRINHLKRVV